MATKLMDGMKSGGKFEGAEAYRIRDVSVLFARTVFAMAVKYIYL
jgi:hypothetical protein